MSEYTSPPGLLSRISASVSTRDEPPYTDEQVAHQATKNGVIRFASPMTTTVLDRAVSDRNLK